MTRFWEERVYSRPQEYLGFWPQTLLSVSPPLPSSLFSFTPLSASFIVSFLLYISLLLLKGNYIPVLSLRISATGSLTLPHS